MHAVRMLCKKIIIEELFNHTIKQGSSVNVIPLLHCTEYTVSKDYYSIVCVSADDFDGFESIVLSTNFLSYITATQGKVTRHASIVAVGNRKGLIGGWLIALVS